jgi:methyl-accepting chemotaxis protein
MRFTVKAKILAAMGFALVAALFVGATGVLGVNRAFKSAGDIYQSNLLAIVHIVNAREQVVDERLALNRGFADPTARGFIQRINADIAAESEDWKRYYPALVSSEHEKLIADAYISLRDKGADLAVQEAKLLDAGKLEDARLLHLTRTADALSKAANAINALIKVNEGQASAAFQSADDSHVRTRNICLTVLFTSAIALLFVALLLTRAIVSPLMKARSLALAINGGRLRNELSVQGNDELADTLRALGDMDRQLAHIVADIREISEEVSGAASDISQGNEDLSQRTQEQASSLEETAASMEELAATVTQNADGAEQARALASRLLESATDGQGVAAQATEAMAGITGASRQIHDIVALIDEIAFQTNLLALNAAVEAARAGDQGRGFAVVAAEVRNLAQRSGTAAREIKVLVSDTVEKVNDGATLVTRTAEVLEGIAKGTRDVSAIVAEIAAASREQSAGIGQVNNAVMTLDDVTQQNAALVEEASAASKATAELAGRLLRQVSFFTIEGEGTKARQKPEAVPQRAVRAPLSAARQGEWTEF